MLQLKNTPNPSLAKSLAKIYGSFSEQDKRTLTPMEFGWLEEDSQKLALFPEHSGAVFIDFLGGKKNHRRQFGGGKGQPLAKAIGLKAGEIPSILDATAGMGGDAFVFATLGCQVTMIERSPVIAALLQDALNRGLQTDKTEILESIQNLSLINVDSTELLSTEQPVVDVIYMDPMYPEKKKKAAPKKEMVALQNLVGPDLDSEKLLEVALQVAKKRVVVKRPAKAPIIELANKREPTMCIKSPNTRYDVYVC